MKSIKYIPTKTNKNLYEDLSFYKPEYSVLHNPDAYIRDSNPIKEEDTSLITIPAVDNPDETPVTLPEEKADEEPITPAKPSSNVDPFISKMSGLYKAELIKRGLNPEFASKLAVQDALESGYGKKIIGNFNFGNITTRNPNVSATEGGDKDAKGKSIRQKFVNYNSIEDYIKAKVDLLNGSRYKAFSGPLEGFFERIQKGGYAESPVYLQSLRNLYKQIFAAKNGMKMPSFENNFPNNTPRGLKLK